MQYLFPGPDNRERVNLRMEECSDLDRPGMRECLMYTREIVINNHHYRVRPVPKNALIKEAKIMLEPGYSPLETGFYRLPTGDMHVRTLTRMPRSSGKMVDWWFGYIKDTETYKMWHHSHRFFQWDEKWCPGHYIGASYITHEYLGTELVKMRISFLDPAEIFDTSKFEAASVGAAIYADIFDSNDVPAGCFIHLIRDTDYGCEMRNRFWMYRITEATALGLMTHNLLEMGNLADFLPDLYVRQHLGK